LQPSSIYSQPIAASVADPQQGEDIYDQGTVTSTPDALHEVRLILLLFRKGYGYSEKDMVILWSLLLDSSHRIPAQMFVSTSGELNHDR